MKKKRNRTLIVKGNTESNPFQRSCTRREQGPKLFRLGKNRRIRIIVRLPVSDRLGREHLKECSKGIGSLYEDLHYLVARLMEKITIFLE